MTLTLTLPIGEFLYTGKQVTFQTPCDSEGLTGLIVDGITYELVNAMGTILVGNSFSEGAMVSVIFNLDTRKAYVQNADTNAYLEGKFNSFNNYTHPKTHPASMITETENQKIMTLAERNKLAGIAEEANKYIHPETHPVSMISGLKEFVDGLGYGKIARGSYVGDGTAINEYTSVYGLKEWGDNGFLYRTILLPFEPSVLILIDNNGSNISFIANGGYKYVDYTYTAGASGSGTKTGQVAHLTGNELQVVYRSFYGSDPTNYITGPNASGVTYNWVIL